MPDWVASAVSAANMVVALMSLIVCVYFSAVARSGTITGHTLKLTIGIALVSGGLFIHRVYWMVQMGLESAEVTFAQTLYSDWSWVTILPMLLMVIGYAHHLSRAMFDAFGDQWRLHYYSAVVALWLLGIWVQEAAK